MPPDLEAIGAAERFDRLGDPEESTVNKFWARIMASGEGRTGYRRYSRNLEEVDNYYFLNWQNSPVQLSLETSHGEGRPTWRKRSLTWTSNSVDLIVGNYTIAEAHGLAIGRYDYRPSAGLTGDVQSSFWYPFNSYYNGLKVDIKLDEISGRFYQSAKKYGQAQKSFYGAGFSYEKSPWAVGLSIGHNQFINQNQSENRLALGLNFNIHPESYSISGEYALLDRESGLYINAERLYNEVAFRTEFWDYGSRFANFNCSGPSVSDYSSFYPDEQALGFRSAQAGETGVSLSYAGKLSYLGLMFWSQEAEDRINGAYKIRARRPLPGNVDLILISSGRIRTSGKYLWLKNGFLFNDPGWLEQLGLKSYFENDGHLADSKSYAYLNMICNLKENLKIFIRLREYFDRGFRLFLGEELTAEKGLSVLAEATIYKGTRISLKIEKSL